MKTSPLSTPRGQALVVIALAAVVLFAFAALAIDGSIVFSDKRHAQNAADTSALAAALAKIRGEDWQAIARARATSNGYTNDGYTIVEVYLCDHPQATCTALPTGAREDEYIQVKITSHVKTTFARVIGRTEMTNRVSAVARATPLITDEWFDGMALVSANPGCPAPGDFGPFEVGGSSVAVVNDSGIFVNSSNSGCNPIDDGGNHNSVTTDQGVCLVDEDPVPSSGPGGVDGFYPPPSEDCAEQVNMSKYWMPDTNPPNLLAPYCSSPGRVDALGGGDFEAYPGYFDGPFPGVNVNGELKLHRGVYCIKDGMSVNGNGTITTDLDGGRVHDPDSEGALFYIKGGNVSINGSAYLWVHAISSTAGGIDSRLLNYLIYVPPSNATEVQISGSSGSTFTGTILAPTSNIDLIGSGGLDLHAQIIGYNTRVSGNGTVNITYDPDENAPSIILPNISQNE